MRNIGEKISRFVFGKFVKTCRELDNRTRRRRQRYTTDTIPEYYDDRPISSDGSTLTSSSIEAMSVNCQ